jgi:hypothetical protein
MTFSEKTIVVSLGTGILVLAYFVIRSISLYTGGIPDPSAVYWLWGITIILVIAFNIAGNILTQILTAIMEAIKTGGEEVEIEDITDERDELIKLRGTQIGYTVFSIGGGLAMLTLVLGQPALVMFSLLTFFGLVAEIVADSMRLRYYRRGV